MAFTYTTEAPAANPFIAGAVATGFTWENVRDWLVERPDFEVNANAYVADAAGKAADATVRGDRREAIFWTKVGRALVDEAGNAYVQDGEMLETLAAKYRVG